VQAAEQAAAALAYEEAVAYYRRALERLDAPDARLLLALAAAEARAGDAAARDTFVRAAELARRDELPEQLAEAALGAVSVWPQAGAIDAEGLALLETAREALGDSDSPLVAMVLARIANVLHFAGEFERVDELTARAVEIARRSGEPAALFTAIESRHAALAHAHLEDRLALSADLLALAQEAGESELEVVARHWCVFDLLEAGQTAAAREHVQALWRLADESRQPRHRCMAVRWDAVWAMLEDRLEDAVRLSGEAEEAGIRAQEPDTEIFTTAQRLALALRQRALGPVAATIEAHIADNPHLQVHRPVLALAHLQAGDRAAAAVEFERLASGDFAGFPPDLVWLSSMCLLAEVCSGLGDERRAAVLYDVLLPHRGRNVMAATAACLGSAERHLGLLAAARRDWDTATAHFEAALAANEAAGIVAMARMVRDDLAQMLLARDEELTST
jgi:tetratricopeptide (TPR) repeat protein